MYRRRYVRVREVWGGTSSFNDVDNGEDDREQKAKQRSDVNCTVAPNWAVALHGKFFGLCSADWLNDGCLMQNILNKYHSLYTLLALDLLNSTLRCFPFLSKLLEQLHNFLGQLICTKHLPRQNLKGESLRRRVSNCVLHYYGLLHCGGSDSSRRNVFPILPFHAWRRFAEWNIGPELWKACIFAAVPKYQYKLHTVHTLFGKVREVAQETKRMLAIHLLQSKICQMTNPIQ